MKYLLRVYELCIKYYVSNVGKHALRYYIIDHFMFSATSLNIIPVIIPSNSKLTIFCLPQSLLEADAIVAVMNMMMVCGWLTAWCQNESKVKLMTVSSKSVCVVNYNSLSSSRAGGFQHWRLWRLGCTSSSSDTDDHHRNRIFSNNHQGARCSLLCLPHFWSSYSATCPRLVMRYVVHAECEVWRIDKKST